MTLPSTISETINGSLRYPSSRRTIPVVSVTLDIVSLCHPHPHPYSQDGWGNANTEIKVLSVENSELSKVSSVKPGADQITDLRVLESTNGVNSARQTRDTTTGI